MADKQAQPAERPPRVRAQWVPNEAERQEASQKIHWMLENCWDADQILAGIMADMVPFVLYDGPHHRSYVE